MLVIFLEMKITSVGSSAFQKNLQRLDQPRLVIFFAFLKKITTTGSSHFPSPNGQGFDLCPDRKELNVKKPLKNN